MSEIEALRDEVAALRKEVADLRASREVHHYHHAPSPLEQIHPAGPYAPRPYYPGGPWPATAGAPYQTNALGQVSQ